MSLSRGQGTVFPHTDGQKTLGRDVRTPCYDTKMHVSLGYMKGYVCYGLQGRCQG